MEKTRALVNLDVKMNSAKSTRDWIGWDPASAIIGLNLLSAEAKGRVLALASVKETQGVKANDPAF